jgi:lysophospholipase L1-like esterase
MRILLILVVVAALAVAIAAAIAVARNQDEDSPAETAGAITLVGDSLNVGVEPYLEDELPGWRVDAHDEVGRATSAGVETLRAIASALAPVVVVSLGTNDAEGSEDAFRRLVDEALALAGPRRCVVWATIVRDGVERAQFDRVLRDAAEIHANLHLVEWAEMVAQDEAVLAADRVHGTPEGYERRAAAIAETVRAC